MREGTERPAADATARDATTPDRDDHHDRQDHKPTRPDLALTVLCGSHFMVVLDVTIVAVTLPRIRADLGFTTATLTWVITAYVLTFGGLLISAGRAGDLFGHRRLFIGGLALFGGASLACGLAWSPMVLIASRAIQGVGGAMIASCALALLGSLFSDGPARRRAVSWWTAAAAGGGASGWVLGGLAADVAGWRAVFLVNVPVAVVAALCATRVVSRDASAESRQRLDLPGAATLTVGVATLIYGLTRGQDEGWTIEIGLIVGAALLVLATFLVIEQRSATPLMPLHAFRIRTLNRSLGVAAMLTATTTPVMFLAVLYQQGTLALDSLQVGLACAPFNLAVIAGSVVGPRVLAAAGVRPTMAIGLLLVAAGAFTFLRTDTDSAYATTLLPGFLLMGAGLGLASVAATSSGTSVTILGQHGLASGLLNAAAQLGTVLGLALLAPLADADTVETFLAGFHTALWVAALMATVAAAPFLVRRPSGQQLP